MRRPVRDAPAPGDAAHVDDVRLPLALDDVDAVEVDAERLPAAHDDLAQFCRGCERLAVLLGVAPDDANAKAIGPLIRLDNEQSPVQERLEPLGAGSDIGVWRGHPCRLENPGGDDLIA